MESPRAHARSSGVFEESRLATSVTSRVSSIDWITMDRMMMDGEMDRKGRSMSIDAIDRMPSMNVSMNASMNVSMNVSMKDESIDESIGRSIEGRVEANARMNDE